MRWTTPPSSRRFPVLVSLALWVLCVDLIDSILPLYRQFLNLGIESTLELLIR